MGAFTRKVPRGVVARLRSSLIVSSTRPTMVCARPNSASPALVSVTRRVLRVNSVVPSSASSPAICLEIWSRARSSLRAAAEKLARRAASTKARRGLSRSMQAIVFDLQTTPCHSDVFRPRLPPRTMRRQGRRRALPTDRSPPMSNPKLDVLTPQNSQLVFIDQQPQMAFGVQSIDRQTLKNNVVALAKAGKAFGIPTTITTVETLSFSGPTYPELLAVFPEAPLLERSSMNSWDDQKVRDALAVNARQGRRKVVVSGLWTEVCNLTFALSAMKDTDYEIYMVADASGGTSKEAHDYAMQRMIQAGVVPVTWQQVLLEWQRDWARKDTYDATIDIVKEHSGAYGMGV